MRASSVSLLVCAFAVSFQAAQGSAPLRTEREQLLYALTKVDLGSVYFDDGASDGSVTQIGQRIESGPNLKPDARVKAVVDLRGSAIPLLIEHLDDARQTRILFKGKPVPLGHIALDILTSIIKPNSDVDIPDCGDDGLGACIDPHYYFRPDASLSEMKRVKGNWRRLYRRGTIVYVYPEWWR
jgi:hypothetical protein